ncbi:MAG: hypothetical protein BGN85_14325 [Alphaproteobacteria bacterium 64-11]|nr:MAG: hypothetical protein BGN85_14325 [Alphaproteobacteria bacterium 64-11]
MLAIIAAVCLTLSAATLGLAYVIGGEAVFHDPRSLEGIRPLIDLATHKEWHWAGGDSLAVNAPVNLRYEPHALPEGAKPNITVTGPAGMVEHVQFADGRIATDSVIARKPGEKLQAVVSGVPIRKFVVNGRETLELGHVDQDSLDIHVNGQGSVRGDGKVGKLTVVVNGSGEADLGALIAQAAKVAILGSGTAIVAPRVSLEALIAGSGHIGLTVKPKSIRRSIIGSGEIDEEGAPEPPARPAPPPPEGPAPPPQPPFEPGAHAIAGNTVTITGNQDVNLGRVEQDELTINVVSQAVVTATGRVKRLKVSLAGSGEARLGGLQTGDANVSIAGSGDVTIAPSGDVRVNIMGSGDLHLATHPRSITRSIVGSGRVIEP